MSSSSGSTSRQLPPTSNIQPQQLSATSRSSNDGSVSNAASSTRPSVGSDTTSSSSAAPLSLSDQQMKNLIHQITTNVTASIVDSIRNGDFAALQGPPGPQGPQGPPATDDDIYGGLQLQDRGTYIGEELGYFQPDLSINDTNPEGEYITVGRDTIFRNVDAFVQRVKDIAGIKGHEGIRNNLYLCLRGAAARWWTYELSDIDKLAIRHDVTPQLQQWTTRLLARFRPRLSQATRENSQLTFLISDIIAGKPVLTYFQSKLLKARAAGYESEQSQLMQVYMGLDVSLK